MRYFIHISPIFTKSSLEELGGITSFSLVDNVLSAAIVDAEDERLQDRIKDSIFTYCAFPLYLTTNLESRSYLKVVLGAVDRLGIGKSRRLKIECVDINEKEGYSAKDIEVATGEKLEGLGYNINIKDPEVLAYVVLMNGKCYSGYCDYSKLDKKFVSPMRHYQSKKQVSRAELKIWQAFDEFGISGGGTAIDLGAAPGGWSTFLAKRGFKVVAIDNGDLDYEAISAQGVRPLAVGIENKIDAAALFISADIVHVKGGFDDAKRLLRMGKADMLTDDMNIFCSDTAIAVESYLDLLKKDAKVIVTVKCISKKAPNYIERARTMLGRKLEIERIKVLPGNRQEFTVLAIPRA